MSSVTGQNSGRFREWAIFFLCFQGFGLRIFDGVMSGAIVLHTFIIFMLCAKNVLRLPAKIWAYYVVIILFSFCFFHLKNVRFPIFLLAAWTSSVFVLSNYWDKRNSFIKDLSRVTHFSMIYSVMHIPIAFLGTLLTTTNLPMHPKTFLYLFWFNKQEGLYGLNRIQGFCWEPSCWNLLLNLNLLFVLYYKKPKWLLFLNIIAIVSIMSTTGLVVMAVILISYYLLFSDVLNKKSVLVGICLFSIISPFVYGELEKKLSNTSGAARSGDFFIAATVMYQSPLLGGDVDNITENKAAMAARIDAWNVEGGDFEGYMNQNMVNSFAALFVEWGLVITFLIFFCFFKTPLIPERKLRFLFVVIVFMVIMGTPISRTGFFYLFVFSTILLKHREKMVNPLSVHTNKNNVWKEKI